MIKMLKNKQGMTLVELITCMVILVLLAASLVIVIGPTLRSFIREKEYADATILINNIADEVGSQLTYATSAALEDGGTAISFDKYGEGRVKLSFEDGLLKRNGAPVFDTGFYKRNTVSGTFAIEASGLFTLTLNITGPNTIAEHSMNRQITIKPIAD